MALWGPSQAGNPRCFRVPWSKVTQCSRRGPQSALQWSPLEPVVFLGREDTPPNASSLILIKCRNRRFGLRFSLYLRDSVDDPGHPVQLRLATEAQILQSLAAGYLSECNQRIGSLPKLFSTN